MRNILLWFSDLWGSVMGWEEGESFNRKLYKLLVFWMFAVIMVLEVTVLQKAVKWHQNTAAAKSKAKPLSYFKNTDNSSTM